MRATLSSWTWQKQQKPTSPALGDCLSRDTCRVCLLSTAAHRISPHPSGRPMNHQFAKAATKNVNLKGLSYVRPLSNNILSKTNRDGSQMLACKQKRETWVSHPKKGPQMALGQKYRLKEKIDQNLRFVGVFFLTQSHMGRPSGNHPFRPETTKGDDRCRAENGVPNHLGAHINGWKETGTRNVKRNILKDRLLPFKKMGVLMYFGWF